MDETPDRVAKEKELQRLLKFQQLLQQQAQLAALQKLQKQRQELEAQLKAVAPKLPVCVSTYIFSMIVSALFEYSHTAAFFPMRCRQYRHASDIADGRRCQPSEAPGCSRGEA